MPENMVRCIRCHEVFDAEEGPCTRCGTPYQPPTSQPRPFEGLYTERYSPTDVVTTNPSMIVVVPPRRRSNLSIWLGAGAALIVAAIVVTMLAALGAFGGSATPRPAFVRAVATPTPTLPPTIALTLRQLNDLSFSSHVKISSQMKMDSSVLGQSMSVNVTFDGEVSNGNQWGTIEAAGISQEIRLVNGEVFSRTLPNGKWSQSAAMPAYLVICPLFGVTNKDIQLVGQEMKDGQLLNHLQSTGSWNPDISRMALADLSSLNVRPDVKVLDLWAKPDGTPVSATFSGTNTAANGTKLVDIEVTYTFSQVGFPQTIDVPSNSPIPSPTK